ncbi:MAG: hypothetical protein GX089_08480 [Fibrobacter sp.]|jgi:hypothetical protein|nr:hypothetical protein [Fibrobacter sp.]HON10882.1 hypothetical protein [Chitinispirillaceae bacterium]
MSIQKLLIAVLLVTAVSFGQQTDTASNKKATTQSSISTSSVVKDSKPLNKQLVTRKNTTTWSKIKDLFM